MEAGNLEVGKHNRPAAGYPSCCFDEESLLGDEANTEGKSAGRAERMKLNFSCTVRTLDLAEPDAKSPPAGGGVG